MVQLIGCVMPGTASRMTLPANTKNGCINQAPVHAFTVVPHSPNHATEDSARAEEEKESSRQRRPSQKSSHNNNNIKRDVAVPAAATKNQVCKGKERETR